MYQVKGSCLHENKSKRDKPFKVITKNDLYYDSALIMCIKE